MSEFENLSKHVPTQYIIWTLLVIAALIVVIYKGYPLIKKWFESARQMANYREDLEKRLEGCTKEIERLTKEFNSINNRCIGSQTHLNKIAEITQRQQQYIEDSMEERELIIRSLLGVVQGLQEVGANGPTKKAEKEIQEYLVRKAHKTPNGVDL